MFAATFKERAVICIGIVLVIALAVLIKLGSDGKLRANQQSYKTVSKIVLRSPKKIELSEIYLLDPYNRVIDQPFDIHGSKVNNMDPKKPLVNIQDDDYNTDFSTGEGSSNNVVELVLKSDRNKVSKIVIRNRTDCCQGDLAGTSVDVVDSFGFSVMKKNLNDNMRQTMDL